MLYLCAVSFRRIWISWNIKKKEKSCSVRVPRICDSVYIRMKTVVGLMVTIFIIWSVHLSSRMIFLDQPGKVVGDNVLSFELQTKILINIVLSNVLTHVLQLSYRVNYNYLRRTTHSTFPYRCLSLNIFYYFPKGWALSHPCTWNTENMRLIWFLGVIAAQNADYYTFDESYESSGSTEQQQMTECTGNSCDLSVNFPTLAIRLPSNQIVQS